MFSGGRTHTHRTRSRHQPKAWYSATRDGRLCCRRCQTIIDRGSLDKHTASCWPEVSVGLYNGGNPGRGDDGSDSRA